MWRFTDRYFPVSEPKSVDTDISHSEIKGRMYYTDNYIYELARLTLVSLQGINLK
jgi:hypothetical protein